MKIKELIQQLEEINQNSQLADVDIKIVDPNGFLYNLEYVSFEEEDNVVVFEIDDGNEE